MGARLKIYNSLNKEIEVFSPVISGEKVVLYVCGITPYDSAHIGHARTFLFFDFLKRFLNYRGYSVFHIQNITDVDDKIIKRCKETGSDPKKLTTFHHDQALALFDSLNVIRADVYPKVTEHINEIVDLCSAIEKQGSAYKTKTGLYFSVSSFKNYGKLSGQNLDEIEKGARIEIDETKQDPADFALWKNTSGEIIEFDSKYGRGRPGWHIECSAMSLHYARRTIDIHGGARDLIFPHHENEIAQSEAATNREFSKYWVHTGFLTVNGEKMSKSLGNFVTLKDALSMFSPNAIRLFFLLAHYRAPLDYSEEILSSMEESVNRIFNSLGLILEAIEKGKNSSFEDLSFRKKADDLLNSIETNLDNDLNTPEALSNLFVLLRLCNSHIISPKVDALALENIHQKLTLLLSVFGLNEGKSTLDSKNDQINSILSSLNESPLKTPSESLDFLVELRQIARKNKDFKKSDLIRDQLLSIGILLEDSKQGVKWKIIDKK